MIFDFLNFLLIGVGVGVVSSYIGFGGGTVIVPLLQLLSGFDVKTSIATAMMVVALNAANNTYSFQKKKLIDWRIAGWICLGSVFSGFLVSRIAGKVDAEAIKVGVIFVYLFLGLIAWQGHQIVPEILRRAEKKNFYLLGLITGTAAAISGVGGGAVVVPFLFAGRWTKNESISPTGNAVNMLTAFAAGISTLLIQIPVSWLAVGVILFSSMLTSHIARKRQGLLPEKQRKMWVLIFIGTIILIQVWKLSH